MTDVRRQASRDSLVERIEPSSAWTEDPSSHYLLVDIPDFKKEWMKLQVDDHGQILVGGEKQTENKIIRFEQTFRLPENSDVEKITGRYDGGILYVNVPKLVKERESLKTATDDNIRGKKHEPKHDQEEHDKQQHEHRQEERDKKHKYNQERGKKHEHHQEEHDKKQELHQEERGEKHDHDQHHEEGHEGERHVSHHGQIVEEGGFLEGGILGSVKEILYKNKGIAVTAVLAFALGVLLSQKFQSNAGSDGPLPPM